jgi:hypothetical protein
LVEPREGALGLVPDPGVLRVRLTAVGLFASVVLAATTPPAVAGSGTSGGACSVEISDSTVWLHGDGRVEVSPVFFDRKPAQGTTALVVPYPLGEAVRLKVLGAERQEDGSWLVRLEDAKATPLGKLQPGSDRRPEAPSDAAVLLPAPEGQVRLLSTTSGGLPPAVSPETVKAALDLDGDARPDVLLVEFCCGRRKTRHDCEYFCGETWQRVGKRWVRCRSWQPA